jgi:hypothetical protein
MRKQFCDMYLQTDSILLLSFFDTAEKFLASVEINANYSLVLLQLVASDQTNMNVRIAAAITFKNFVKHNWHMVCTSADMHARW